MSSLPAKISPATQFDGIRLSVAQDDLPDFDVATPIEDEDLTWADWSRDHAAAAADFDRAHFLEFFRGLLLSLQDSTLVRELQPDEVEPFYGLYSGVKHGRMTSAYAWRVIECDARQMHEDTAVVVFGAVRYWRICRESHAAKQGGVKH